MIVVADSGPLISLARIECFHLLEKLFLKVLIPETVLNELEAGGFERPAFMTATQTRGTEVRSIASDDAILLSLQERVDPGEAAAIALAVSEEADALLCDDRKGRRIGRELGLRVIGTLGLLAEAKAIGLLDELTPYIRNLLDAGFRASPTLIRAVLKDAGEDADAFARLRPTQ